MANKDSKIGYFPIETGVKIASTNSKKYKTQSFCGRNYDMELLVFTRSGFLVLTTYKVSDILKYKTGWCYAKSHLLAALLRANGIPVGFTYQRLSCSEYKKDIYCLHGLNAVYLKEYGWYRVDARGNKEGVNAQFNPPYEQLAFELGENEYDLPEILSEPLDEVVHALKKYQTYDEMVENFPDIRKDKKDENKI